MWGEVRDRMEDQIAPRHETLDAFKTRLRRTAFAIPTGVIDKMLGAMAGSAQSVYDKNGGHTPRD